MKKIFKRVIGSFLAFCARILLWRKKPEIIAITGSAGKTTAKSFLAELLSIDFNVLASSEGYNSDIGAPLVLFGEKIPKKITSVIGWFLIAFKVFFKALLVGDYPEKVIVEMGADTPGDIEYLCKLFKPQKGIILSVLPTHLLEFKTVAAVAKEKSILAKSIPKGGKLFLNYDDAQVRDMSKNTKADVVFFGCEKGANYRIENLKSDLSGTSFTLNYFGERADFSPKVYGEQMIYPLTASIIAALDEGINKTKIKETVSELKPFKGRMNVIPGIKGSTIVDDSYNSSPGPAILALDFLSQQKSPALTREGSSTQGGRKIAVLGSMNELGEYEKKAHREVGAKASAVADVIVTVGDVAKKYLADEAIKNGFPKEDIKSFMDSVKAGEYLKKIIAKGDVVLVKGSQNKIRLEKTVAKIMANPKDAKDVLVRQSEFWQKES